MRLATSLWLAGCFCSSAAAQNPAPARFDPARATEYADSFTTLVHGQPKGWHTYVLRRTAAGFEYAESFDIPGLLSHFVRVQLDPALAVRHASDSGDVLGFMSSSDLEYTGQRARGTLRPRPHGNDAPTSVTIDTAFAPGTVNGLALLALLPTLDLQPSGRYKLSVYDTDERSVTTQALRIVAEETVAVPAGSFDCYRAELSTTQAPVLLWYTRSAPHRLVKLATVDTSIVDVLAVHRP